MMYRDLDAEFPQGDPASPTCRWCDGERVVIRAAGIVCPKCDGGAAMQRSEPNAA